MKRFVACSLLLVLAACGGPAQKPAPGNAEPGRPQAQNSGQVTPSTPEKAAKPAPTSPNPAPKPSANQAPRQSATLAPEPAEPTAPEIPVNDDPAQFMNVGDSDLRDVLGDPALIRRDGAAEVWQFRGDDCTLDLFLYPAEGGALAVKHVELRGEAPDERRACLARMIRARIIAADG